jgi:hypothetical protein
MPEADHRGPPHAGLGASLLAEHVQQLQPLDATAFRLHGVQELHHRVLGGARLVLVRHVVTLRGSSILSGVSWAE